MTDNNKDLLEKGESLSLSIDFGKYLGILKKRWKTVLLWTAGGFALGCLIALGTPRKYTCVSKLAPELSSTATSRLSSVASMIGFTSLVLGTTDAVYPMVYPDLVHSPEFIVDLFDLPVDFVHKKDSVHTTLYDYLENYSGQTTVGNIIFAPMNLLGKLIEKIKDDGETDSTEYVDPFKMTRKQVLIYKKLCRCIDAQIDKKTLVVTIRTSLDNRFLCAELSREVNENLKRHVTRYRTEKAVHDRDYYEEMYINARDEYFAAQEAYTRYMDSHQNITLQRVKAEGERLKNESNLKYQLYSTMSQQFQNAEAKVQMETPVCAEIVSPTTPFRSVNSRKKKALGFALFGLLAGAVFVLLKNK